MAAPLTIAVVSAGAMGSAVAARLVANRCIVLTNLDGRSASSMDRAMKAGMQIVPLEEMVTRAEWLLSIVPPDRAERFAQQVFDECERSRKKSAFPPLKFADCNATNPTTVKRISVMAKRADCPMVDASIIGGPPSDAYSPTFYASSDDTTVLGDFYKLADHGLNITLLDRDGASIGDASALKMSYAGISKGMTGLAIAMILSAHRSSPATAQALLTELASSQSPTLKRLARMIPDALPKAYRFEGEMREISEFVSGQLGEGEGQIHQGLAEVYHTVAASLEGHNTGETHADVLRRFADGAKSLIAEPKPESK